MTAATGKRRIGGACPIASFSSRAFSVSSVLSLARSAGLDRPPASAATIVDLPDAGLQAGVVLFRTGACAAMLLRDVALELGDEDGDELGSEQLLVQASEDARLDL